MSFNVQTHGDRLGGNVSSGIPAVGGCVTPRKPIITTCFGPVCTQLLCCVKSVKIKYLLGMLSPASRKAITKKWLKPDIPCIDEC